MYVMGMYTYLLVDRELLRIPPHRHRRLCLLAELRRGIEGGRWSSVWGGERERLMENKAVSNI